MFWGRGRSFEDLGDLDVCIGDVGAVGQGRDGVGRFVPDECEHVGGGLVQVFVGGDFGKRNIVGKSVDG